MAWTNRSDRRSPGGATAGRGLRRDGAYETGRFYTHKLSLLNRLIARTTKEMLAARFGLSQMEWRVLVQLECRSPSKVAEIHERSLVQKPQISAVLPLLARRGYVVRHDDPDDARAPWFAITEAGLEVYREVLRLSRKRQRNLEALLSERERTGFESAVDRLIAYFVNETESGGDAVFGGTAPRQRATTARE